MIRVERLNTIINCHLTGRIIEVWSSLFGLPPENGGAILATETDSFKQARQDKTRQMKGAISGVAKKSHLFTNFTFQTGQKGVNLTLPNRIVIAPMCQYSSDNGEANDWHLMHWGNLLNSGAGLLILEATAINPNGRISTKCLGLWDDRTQAALSNNLNRAKKLAPNIPIFIQLCHAGRKGSTSEPWKQNGGIVSLENGGWMTMAPSSISVHENKNEKNKNQLHTISNCIPIEMNSEDMKKIRLDFVNAAKRAKMIGLDGIEIHSAHGYLLHQFLSPLSNQRSDQYGGSLQNRLRFPLEVFESVRDVFDGVLGVRFSATDWVEKGWDLEESLLYSQELVKIGCNYLHVSSGGLSSHQKIKVGPGYQLSFAEAIKKVVPNTPVIAVGLITEPQQAEEILQKGQADLVALARGFLFKPRWGWEAAIALNGTVDASSQYWRCLPAGSPRETFHYPNK
jgi:2,4-dienoyl-CoA reductase-like NADH-dependent reductase (Old Yellow Enzyme family)